MEEPTTRKNSVRGPFVSRKRFDGMQWVAHFSPTTHDDIMMKSPVPGPVTTVYVILPEHCPLPQLVALEVGAQRIAETDVLIPINDNSSRTYEVSFFLEPVSLPLHKLFFHFVEVIIKGEGSFEGSQVVLVGDEHLSIPIPPQLSSAPGLPYVVDTPGVEEETITIKPRIGQFRQVRFAGGQAMPTTTPY
jgi:hypothetical protein